MPKITGFKWVKNHRSLITIYGGRKRRNLKGKRRNTSYIFKRNRLKRV